MSGKNLKFENFLFIKIWWLSILIFSIFLESQVAVELRLRRDITNRHGSTPCVVGSGHYIVHEKRKLPLLSNYPKSISGSGRVRVGLYHRMFWGIGNMKVFTNKSKIKIKSMHFFFYI